MASIATFPNETLSIVFEYFVESSWERGLRPIHRLMLVCRRWNEVAQSTPGLWTTIYLAGQHISLGQLDSQLRRSGAMPLKVTISEVDGPLLEVVDPIMLDCLFRHAYHFASLQIRVGPRFMGEMVQRIGVLAFPVLHTLELIPMNFRVWQGKGEVGNSRSGDDSGEDDEPGSGNDSDRI
ncbi:hypothetical protein C8F01DRAFT_1121606, partial [Mycena amicta]